MTDIRFMVKSGFIAFLFVTIHQLGFSQRSASIEDLKYARFYRLTIEDGLSDNSSKAILKDSYGFMWFGTLDGLSKYDGYTFTNYKSDPTEINSLADNYITTIVEDHNGNLWIGTNSRGVCFYDRKLDRFTRRFSSFEADSSFKLKSNIVHSLLVDGDVLWVGTEFGGLHKISISEKEVLPLESAGLPSSIYQIEKGFSDNLFLIKNEPHGFCLFNPKRKSVKCWDDFDQVDLSINQYVKNSIFIQNDSIIWLGSPGNGVYKIKFDRGNEDFVLLKSYSAELENLGHDNVTDIDADSDNNIWVSSDGGGINIIPCDDSGYIELRELNDDKYSLSTNAVYEIYKDNSGIMWLGTFAGGMNYCLSEKQKFVHYRNSATIDSPISSDAVMFALEDPDNNLIIGTDGGGIALFDVKAKTFKPWGSTQGVDFRISKSILRDADGNYWIGTYGKGLFKLDSDGELIRHYLYDPRDSTSLSHNSIWSIYQDAGENIWIGSLGGGLMWYNSRNDNFERYQANGYPNSISNNIVRAIIEDDEQNLWIGTSNGLNMLNTNSGRIKQYFYNPHINSISNNDIRFLIRDENGWIWIGTKGGVNIYNPDADTFKSFDSKDGLPGDAIYGIEIDNKGNYWISTSNRGLSKVQLVNSWDSLSIACWNFSKGAGLQSNQFSYTASLKTRSGKLFFGGREGFNLFNPDSIKIDSSQTQIVFTDLQIQNRSVLEISENGILSSHINTVKEIDIPHQKNVFSLSFAALNFYSKDKTQYSYWLEGFNTTWQNPGKNRQVTYTNLDPGKYLFKVKATNSDGIWGDDFASIVINIIPPWYKTTWAKVIFLLLLFSLIYGGVKLRVNLIKRQKVALQTLVEEQTVELRKANERLFENQKKITFQNDELREKINHIKEQQSKIESQNNELLQARNDLDVANQSLVEINKTLEQRVKKRTHELEKSNKELDRFVYSASHDISAPLKSLLGLITLARMDDKMENWFNYIDHMELSVHRLDDVISNLIQHSKNTKQRIIKHKFTLHKIVWDVIHGLEYLNQAKENIIFIVDIDPELKIYSDEGRLRIILNNLISNSIKYHNFRQEKPFIKISFESKSKAGHLKVEDNGLGISEEFKDNIFNMFFRASTTSTGAGLGLYIVKETVDKLNGKIKFQSILGKGTTFMISFKNILPSELIRGK